MQLSITVDIKPLQTALAGNAKQARFAGSQAINDVAFKARTAVQQAERSKFDRPTPYIITANRVHMSTPDTLTATLQPTYLGGKGVDPQNTLRAEVFGGERKQKAGEAALQRVGILPQGYYIVPGQGCPLDQYGNVRGSFMRQIISYFGAAGEQGYNANMTDKRKAKLANRGKNANGYATINGVVYFVAYGKLRSGRTHHLAPGIWSKTGTHGANVKPILMFVRKPRYQQRLPYNQLSADVVTKEFPSAFDRRYATALRTAR